MNIKDLIHNQITLVERAERAKRMLHERGIVWETEISSMDFSALRSKINFEDTRKTMRLGKINPMTCRNDYADGNGDLYDYDSANTLTLTELIATGKKITPPIFVDLYEEVDGERAPLDKGIMYDGSHRLWIAKYLQLDEIPIVVCDLNYDYYFTPSKWTFNFSNDMFSAKSTFNDKEYIFDNSRITCKESVLNHLAITEHG